MTTPSRVVSYRNSVISKFPLILHELSQCGNDGVSPLALYNTVKGEMKDIAEYTEALDCLYVLGRIVLDSEKGVLRRVS